MAKRRLKTILSLAEQNCQVLKANTNTDFASIILNSDIVFLDKNNFDEFSPSYKLVSNETENTGADDKRESTTEYLIVDENHINLEASKEIIDFSKLHFSDFINYDATGITSGICNNFTNHDDSSMITYEIDINKSTEDIENVENKDKINLTDQDSNTKITFETHINANRLDIEDSSSNCDRTVTKKRKRSLKTNLVKWKREVTKKKRMSGDAYIGYSRHGKNVEHNTNRKKRTMKATCSSKKCQSLKNRFCQLFDEDMRQNIFNKYWSATWEEKKTFVTTMVINTSRKRDTT